MHRSQSTGNQSRRRSRRSLRTRSREGSIGGAPTPGNAPFWRRVLRLVTRPSTWSAVLTVGGPSGPDESISRRSVGPGRVKEWPPRPLPSTSIAPTAGLRAGTSFRLCVRAGHSRGGVCGSTRPAPIRRAPYRPAKPAARPRPRQRGHHPGPRPRRS